MGKNVSDDDILKSWKRYGTVKSVSVNLGISYNKVIKALATKGIIINPTHKKILDFYNQGKTTAEIANLLKMNEKVVKAYIPRTRPQYNVNQSENALKIKNWRESKNKNNV